MNCRTFVRLLVILAAASTWTFAATCQNVLGSLTGASGCTVGDEIFSAFSFTSILGSDPIGPSNIFVASRSSLPVGVNLSSTPLVYDPSGTVEVEIGFTVTSSMSNLIVGVDVTPGGGQAGSAARPLVTTFICLGAPAVVSPGGSIECSTGPLLQFDASFNGANSLSFSGFSTIGVVNDIFVQSTTASYGELQDLTDRFAEAAATPEPGTSGLLLLGLIGVGGFLRVPCLSRFQSGRCGFGEIRDRALARYGFWVARRARRSWEPQS